MSEHTETPWSVGQTRKHHNGNWHETLIHVGDYSKTGCGIGNAIAIVYTGGNGACSLQPADIEANAAYIVEAVNAHAALTARVAELMAALRDAWNALPSSSPVWARVDAALAKVEGGTP
jgi:hypothetical protein